MDKRILKEVRTTGFSYLRIPKGMLGDAGHALQLNCDAILLYAMLLDRARSASYAGHQIDSTGHKIPYRRSLAGQQERYAKRLPLCRLLA